MYNKNAHTLSMMIAGIVIVIGLLIMPVGALAAELWSIEFTTSISGLPEDLFEAGADDLATDGYDPFADAFQLTPPGGKYSTMYSLASPYALAKDTRSQFEGTKTWQIEKAANDPDGAGLSGTDSLSWMTNTVPGNVELTLVDYGSDHTRTSAVATIDLKATSSYDVVVSNANGVYRYLDFIAERAVITGDVNEDCIVNIIDLVTVAVAVGSSPGDPNWNPAADLNNDGSISIFDLILVVRNYRETC